MNILLRANIWLKYCLTLKKEWKKFKNTQALLLLINFLGYTREHNVYDAKLWSFYDTADTDLIISDAIPITGWASKVHQTAARQAGAKHCYKG